MLKVACTARRNMYTGLHQHIKAWQFDATPLPFPFIFRIRGHRKSIHFRGAFLKLYSSKILNVIKGMRKLTYVCHIYQNSNFSSTCPSIYHLVGGGVNACVQCETCLRHMIRQGFGIMMCRGLFVFLNKTWKQNVDKTTWLNNTWLMESPKADGNKIFILIAICPLLDMVLTFQRLQIIQAEKHTVSLSSSYEDDEYICP